MLTRRAFLRMAGIQAAAAGAGGSALSTPALATAAPSTGKADFTLRIATSSVELAPNVVIKTTTFNGTIPGPMIRVKEGTPVTIDVFNESSVDDLTHWHGLEIDALNDGAMEEGSRMNPARTGMVRYTFVASPSGSRWYHSHASAGMNTGAGGYSGQFGFFYIDGKSDSGAYDVEVFLAVHHWQPTVVVSTSPRAGQQVVYKYASFNGRLGSASEPIRVRKGQRVRFHLLNASATDAVTLALPGHQFEVNALDGNPVPNRKRVSTLTLGVAERVDAVVEMDHPGVWALASTTDSERAMGLSVPIEYAGYGGPAVWRDPESIDWSYANFADSDTRTYAPDRTVPMVFSVVRASDGGMDRWTVNGKSFPDNPVLTIQEGKRYRLALLNASTEAHPMHLHRHRFEITSIAGQPMSGLIKDTVNVEPWKKVEIDFVANNPGRSLFHCHQQLHMDCGLMQLIDYSKS